MIIGSGMLAREFKSYEEDQHTLIFASGVSNSNETRISEFNREKELLIDCINKNTNKKLIYFSSCSMYDTYFPNNKYTEHKLNMESIISYNSNNYTIFRLSQVVGKNNKSQLLGFLNDKIQNNEEFTLFDIERNIIDISDVKEIVDMIIQQENSASNKIINIANKNNIPVIKLVHKIEKLLNKKAIYTILEKNGKFEIDTKSIFDALNQLNINNNTYIDSILRKYYE